MDLLTVIQNAVLKQLEEARNFFSQVSDFRRFISETRPSPNVVTTLKLRCVSAERLNGGYGTCFIVVDAIQPASHHHAAMKKNKYVQIIVWDCKTTEGATCNVEFESGAVFAFHQVEYVGIYDDVAKGCVVFDPACELQIELISPALQRSVGSSLTAVPTRVHVDSAVVIDGDFGPAIENHGDAGTQWPHQASTAIYKSSQDKV